jgi:hypothetical protein
MATSAPEEDNEFPSLCCSCKYGIVMKLQSNMDPHSPVNTYYKCDNANGGFMSPGFNNVLECGMWTLKVLDKRPGNEKK